MNTIVLNNDKCCSYFGPLSSKMINNDMFQSVIKSLYDNKEFYQSDKSGGSFFVYEPTEDEIILRAVQRTFRSAESYLTEDRIIVHFYN